MNKEKNIKKENNKNENGKTPVRHIVNLAVVGTLFVGATVAMLVMEHPTVSYIEKRDLAEFPELNYENLVSGKFSDGVSEYYNDTVPYRDTFKNISANIRNMMGFSIGGTSIYGNLQKVTTTEASVPSSTEPYNVGDSGTSSTQSTTVTTPEDTTTTTYDPKNEIAEGVITNGQIIVYQDGHYRAISLFGGGSGETYANALNLLRNNIDDKINMYSMIIPTSGEYYTPSNFAEYTSSHKDSVDSINSQLTDGIVAVDAISALQKHVSENIYTRTDHHWQPLGAYYAAEALADAAGFNFDDLSEYDEETINGYVGSFYGITGDANLLNDPEDFVYYYPPTDYKATYYTTDFTYDESCKYFSTYIIDMPDASSAYSMFMGGDEKIVKIEADNGTGKKLMVVKDSYGNAEIPFYIGSFDEIYVCDMRYFDTNMLSFIEEQGITDILFTMCTFSAVGTNATTLYDTVESAVSTVDKKAEE